MSSWFRVLVTSIANVFGRALSLDTGLAFVVVALADALGIEQNGNAF